jgi:hypothetical protein
MAVSTFPMGKGRGKGHMKRAANSAPLEEATVTRIRSWVATYGEKAVTAKLRISRPTLGRVCAGFPISGATRYMIERLAADARTVRGAWHVG